MKNIIYIVLITGLFIISSNKTIKAQDQKIIVAGECLNKDKDVYIYFYGDNPHYNSNKKIELDSEGKFKEYITLSENEIMRISKDKKLFQFYACPGDSIFINTKNVFSGDNSKVNNYLVSSFTEKNKRFEDLVSSEAADYRRNKQIKNLKKIDECEIQNKDFIKRLRAQEYWDNHYYTLYFTEQQYGEIEIKNPDKTYYDDINSLDINENNISCYNKWFIFLEKYFKHLEKNNKINSTVSNYIEQRTLQLKDPELRETFVLEAINKGLIFEFAFQSENIKNSERFVTTKEGIRQLNILKEKVALNEEKFKNLQAGMPAPDFTAENMNGENVSLSDFKGKFVLLDMWSLGCGPCKSEMPHLKILEEFFHGKNIEFITLSFDKMKHREKLKTYIRTHKLCGIQLNDPRAFKSPIRSHYLVRGVPRYILIDTKGNIIDANSRRPSDPLLKRMLIKLLK